MDQTCNDCKRVSPPTRTEHTLLSATHGWRLQRVVNADGSVSLLWRCPSCWSRRKATTPTPQSLGTPRGIFRAAARLFNRDSEGPPPSKE
jgi:hypothetical protein